MAKVYELTDPRVIEQEARQWLIRLDGDTEPDQDEIDALRQWVNRSPAHRKELLRLSAFWNDANILIELSIPLHAKPGEQPNRSERRALGVDFTALLSLKSIRLTAAVFTLAIFGALMTNLFQPASQFGGNGIYATAIGEMKMHTLPDGSVIQLNTDSQLLVDYSEAVRKIRILRGETHFDVTKDPERPFEVYAGNGMVKAIGTAFSVHLDKNRVKVTVNEGQVDLSALVGDPKVSVEKISTPGAVSSHVDRASVQQPVLRKIGSLKRGQTATFRDEALKLENAETGSASLIEEVADLGQQELQRRLSWREGYLVFAGEPLSYIVGEVNRYTPITIDIADAELQRLRIGGRFKIGELDAMLEVLEQSFGIQVSWQDDQNVQLLPAQR